MVCKAASVCVYVCVRARECAEPERFWRQCHISGGNGDKNKDDFMVSAGPTVKGSCDRDTPLQQHWRSIPGLSLAAAAEEEPFLLQTRGVARLQEEPEPAEHVLLRGQQGVEGVRQVRAGGGFWEPGRAHLGGGRRVRRAHSRAYRHTCGRSQDPYRHT